LVKASDSVAPNDNKSEGKVVIWGTACLVTMHSESNQWEMHHNGRNQVGCPIKICQKTMIIAASEQGTNNVAKVLHKSDYVSQTETTKVMNNSFLVTFLQT